ncbi:MAG TPA: hypothetical protein VID27_20215 [Blastocatellia bacterium]
MTRLFTIILMAVAISFAQGPAPKTDQITAFVHVNVILVIGSRVAEDARPNK